MLPFTIKNKKAKNSQKSIQLLSLANQNSATKENTTPNKKNPFPPKKGKKTRNNNKLLFFFYCLSI